MVARHIFLNRCHEAQQRVYDTWLRCGGREVEGSLGLAGSECGLSKQRVHQIVAAVERRAAKARTRFGEMP